MIDSSTYIKPIDALQAQLERIIKLDDRVAVFIDGYATLAALRHLIASSGPNIPAQLDWEQFRIEFQELCRLRNLNFYMSVRPQSGDEQYQEWRPLSDWLNYNGYNVKIHTGKEVTIRHNNTDTEATDMMCGMEIDLTVDALTIAPHIDHFVLMASNPYFEPLLAALQNRGIVTTVIANSAVRRRQAAAKQEGSEKSSFGPVASKLIRCSNNLIELEDVYQRFPKNSTVKQGD